jgi:hypothetical protein
MNDHAQSGSLRALQFSLASMFILMTVVALVLSIYFGVGRLFGMSTMEVLTQGLGQFLFLLPTFLVWIVGLTLAIRRLKRNRLPATLAMIALGGMILSVFVIQVAQMALLHSVNSGRISHTVLSWSFIMIRVLYAPVSTMYGIISSCNTKQRSIHNDR